jgi:hypothetical protein
MPVDEMKIFFHQTLGDVRYFSSCHRWREEADDHERFLWVFCREIRIEED